MVRLGNFCLLSRHFVPDGLRAAYLGCYPIHREHAYDVLMNDRDREMFVWVNDFNQYDLYTKRSERMDVAALRPFYEELINEYFPSQIDW